MFLQRLARNYELVIFGDEENGIVTDICEALDPNYEMIAGRLGRESTLLRNGIYVKDLSYMNRPIKEIVYIDFNDEKVEFHKDNCIILPRWEGDRSDRELYDILPFLESLSQSKGDVRDEIRQYGREGTGKKFQDVQTMRRDMILKQRVSVELIWVEHGNQRNGWEFGQVAGRKPGKLIQLVFRKQQELMII